MAVSFPGVPDVTRQFAADPFASLQLGMERSRQNRLNRVLDPLAIEKAQRENRLAREKEISDKQRAAKAAQQQQMQQGFLVANVLKSIPVDQRPTVAATLAKKYPALDIDPNDDYSDEMLDLALNVESAINANDPERAKIAIDALNARTKVFEAKSERLKVEQGDFEAVTGSPGSILNTKTGEVSVNPLIVNAAQKNAWDAKAITAINKDTHTRFIANAQEVYNSAADLQSLSEDATNSDSIAVIFRFMKALDPTSTVREGEYATVQNSGGAPAAVINAYNSILGGSKLTQTQLENITRTASKLSNGKVSNARRQARAYLETLEENGLPEETTDSILDQFPRLLEVRMPAKEDAGAQTQGVGGQKGRGLRRQGAQKSDPRAAIYEKYGVK